MKKILVIIGTRPEAIKLAPIISLLKKSPEEFETTICVTAQHRDMLDQMLNLFSIHPDIDLNLMRENQSLHLLTSQILNKITEVLIEIKPHVVLVQGDTTTAMASALGAFYQKVLIGHVEAGLRTHNRYSPFPEEINRQLIGTIASFHFAPTKNAVDNLKNEGFHEANIFQTGNTVVDALHTILREDKINRNGFIKKKLSLHGYKDGQKIILVTAHRRENFGTPLVNICKALNQLTTIHPDVFIVYPVHQNPLVKSTVVKLLGNQPRIALLEPLDYREFVHLLYNCYFVLTDSGGIQEEAPALAKPVLVMRDNTERPEAIECGISQLVGTCDKKIFEEANRLLCDEKAYLKMASSISPYGDGRAADRICQILKNACV